jgi:hypothetical protein
LIPSLLVKLVTEASRTPEMVTEDWAKDVLTAARAAKATRVFFIIEKSPKVKHRAPTEFRLPGPTSSFKEVKGI